MKSLVQYTTILLMLVFTVSALNIEAATMTVRTVQEQEAGDLGYQAGYSNGRSAGFLKGSSDGSGQLSDNDQQRTLSLESILQRTDNYLADQALDSYARHSFQFADADAREAFKERYRNGYGAGWENGYQEGLAYAPTIRPLLIPAYPFDE